ncbi:MAG TPA: hypothetical protein VGC67_17880 [Cellulomonas sp.]
MDDIWLDDLRRQLIDFTRCPSCGAGLTSVRCTYCGVRLDGPQARAVADASWATAAALAERQRLVGVLRAAAGAPGPAPAPRAAAPSAQRPSVPGPLMPRPPVVQRPQVRPGTAPPATMRPVPTPPHAPFAAPGAVAAPAQQLDVAALFALAGSGLVAAAALVFAFFMLADAPAARSLVLLVATGAGVVGTVLLRRRGIGSSAEAVAGLSAALVVVDTWMLAVLVPGRARWAMLAVLLLAAGLGVTAAGRALRLRSWTTAALVLPLVPLCLAGAVGTPGSRPIIWVIAVMSGSLVTLLRREHRRIVRAALGTDPEVEGWLLGATGAALLALAFPIGTYGVVTTGTDLVWPAGAVALTLLLMAAVALAQARVGCLPAWTATAGGLVVTAASVSVLVTSSTLLVGLSPLAAAAAWVLLLLVARRWPDRPSGAPRESAAAGPTGTVSASDPRATSLVAGGWLAVLLVALPGSVWSVVSVLALVPEPGAASSGSPVADLDSTVFDRFGSSDAGLTGPVLAAAVLAAALLVAARLPLTELRTVGLARPVGPVPPGTPIGTLPQAGEPVALVRADVALVVQVGRLLGPAATVLLASAAVAMLRPWAVPVLATEMLLAAVLVEAARRLPARGAADAAPTAPTAGFGVAATADQVFAVPSVRPVLLRERQAWAVTVRVALVAQLLLLTAMTWVARPVLVVGTIVLVALLLRARTLAAPAWRPALVVLAAAYPAAVLAVQLTWEGWDGYATIGVLAVLLVALAAAATAVRRVDHGSWLALLAVAAPPAVLGIAMTVLERTLWSAAVAMVLLVAEAVLLAVRARPVPDGLRVAAAALVVPTVSVAVISAGAVWLPGSGAPVLLPVIAVLVVAVAIGAPTTAERLGVRTGTLPVEDCRQAVESAAAATAAIALLLALVRPSTGASTVLELCAILGAGATVVAQRPDRRPVWWAAALLWLGVVWTALVWSGVGLVEAYTVPPALLALGVGMLAVRAGSIRAPLAATGVALLIAPTLLLATVGRATGIRTALLLAVAAALLTVTVVTDRPRARDRFGPVTDVLALGAMAAGLAGPLRALHLAAGTPIGSEIRNAEVFLSALAWSALGAGVLAVAGRVLADRRGGAARTWAFVPALVAGSIGTLAAVRPTWTVVWTTWAVELALLGLAVLSVRLAAGAPDGAGARPGPRPVPGAHPVAGERSLPGERPAVLPPGWLLWLLATVWAISGWSLRELRVEVFALPLGLALTMIGLTALRAGDAPAAPAAAGPAVGPRPVRTWPIGFTGSVATLTPGLLATLGPSMLAIWTDPLTWRAIMVVVLALGAMLLGARQMLRAPLVVGAAALPVAVVSVFAGRLGRAVSVGPWLLTLLAAGGLLLVLGIYFERRRTLLAAAGTEAEPARVLR